jgi:hypothetical protein
VAADDPRVQAMAAWASPGGGAMMFGPDGNVKVEFDESGQTTRSKRRHRWEYGQPLRTSGNTPAGRAPAPCSGGARTPRTTAIRSTIPWGRTRSRTCGA